MDKFDKEGFLIELSDWSESLAEEIAQAEGISLSEEHWQIIFLLRNFYTEFERSPNMRALIAYLKKQIEPAVAKEVAQP